MKPVWQRLMVCYAALCVVFAAFVGRSPLLHVWIDHHGHSAEHVHDKASRVARRLPSIHSHPHPHPHPHSPEKSVPATDTLRLREALSSGQKTVTLFGLSTHDLYHGLAGLVTLALEQLPEPAESEQGEHTHHTLSQLLLSGVLEVLAWSPHIGPPQLPEALLPPPVPQRTAADWNAATATRGPPACC